MNIIRNLAGAAAAAALLAACSSSPHTSHVAASAPATAATGRSSAPAGSRTPASPASGSPAVAPAGSSTAAGPLTMKQAKLTYARIVGPGNALANKVGSAASGTVPFSEFRTDALAYAKELHAEIGKFEAVRWPAKAQSSINALIRTTYPADIGCLQAVAAAGSNAGAQAVSNSDKNCQVADNSSIPAALG